MGQDCCLTVTSLTLITAGDCLLSEIVVIHIVNMGTCTAVASSCRDRPSDSVSHTINACAIARSLFRMPLTSSHTLFDDDVGGTTNTIGHMKSGLI